MTTLSITPQPLELNLAITLDSVPELALDVQASPQPQMTLDVLAGTPGPTTDLQPLLDGLESISDALPVDLTPVLDAVAPLATSADLANATDTVLARLDALPAPDVSAAVAPLATTEQLDASEARTLGAIAAIPAPDIGAALTGYGAAKTTDVTALHTAILSALDPKPGQGARCMRASIPDGWAEVAVEAASAAIAGAFLPFTAAGAGGSTGSSFAIVTEGTAAGAWRYMSGNPLTGGLQRFDLNTGLPVGPRYPSPVSTVTSSLPFLVAVGRHLYIGATAASTTLSSGRADLHRFDTETGVGEALASFPKSLTHGEAVHLGEGRILVTASAVAGAYQQPDACSFFIYDTTLNTPPVEVVIDVRITKYPAGTGEGMRVLPSGVVLIVDKALNAQSSKQCSRLFVGVDNSITVGAVEETGSTGVNLHNLLETETGVHMFNAAGSVVQRTYVEGQGWGPAALTLAYPNTAAAGTPNGLARTVPLPGGGWLVTCQTSAGGCYHCLLCPGLHARGDVLVDIYKL